jgi:translocation and assembly module TamB
LELRERKSDRLIARIGRIDVAFSVTDYLRQKATITRIEIVEPEIWIERDKQGRSNLEGITEPSQTAKREDQIKYRGAELSLTEGKLHFADLRSEVVADVAGLSATLTPQSGLQEQLDHQLKLAAERVAGAYQGREVKEFKLNVDTHIVEGAAEIAKVEIVSQTAHAVASGRIEFKPLKYEVRVWSEGSLGDITRVVAPENRVAGKATFDGRIEGTGSQYRIGGGVTSEAVEVAGYRIGGINLSTTLNGRDDALGGDALASLAAASGNGFSASRFRLEGKLDGRWPDLGISGGLAVGSAEAQGVAINNFAARVDADSDSLSLSNIRGAIMGGSIGGSASIAVRGGRSKVDLSFDSIDFARAAEMLSPKDVKVTGNVSGAAHLAFSGFNYKSATGSVNATFTAEVIASPPAQGDLPPEIRPVTPGPTSGEVSLQATGRGFHIEKAVVRSAKSEATAAGDINWAGDGSLTIEFRSEDMSEVYGAVDALGLIPDRVRDDYEPSIKGPGEFRGRVTGSITTPEVGGHLRLAAIETHGELLGSFEGEIGFSKSDRGSVLSIKNASLIGDQGSRADFSLDAPFPAKNNISVQARLDHFDLPALVRAGQPRLAQFVGRGLISGSIQLSGLPGSRTLGGSGEISLSGAEFLLTPPEPTEELIHVSVPELAGKVAIANSVITVDGLRLLVRDSAIAGTGMFNLDTNEYRVDAEGKNIDLAQVSDAALNTKFAGIADVAVKGEGKWDDLSSTKITANLQGRNVTLEGRPLGDARLAAYTENGLLKVEATGRVVEQTGTIVATIDLRDREAYPVSANVDFADADLGPYLGLIAPQLSGISGTATGSIKLSGPLQDPDRIQAVATLSVLRFGGAISEGKRYTIANRDPVVVSASLKEITVSKVGFSGEGTNVSVEGTLAREGGGASGLAVNGELNMRFLSSFTDVLFATGVAKVQASVVGSLDSPRMLGTANLIDVGVRVLDFPLSLTHGNGVIRFTADQALLEDFSGATPGGGTIAMRGGAALSGLVPDRWRVEVQAEQVGVEYPRDTQTMIDASLVLQGNRRLQVLSGDVDVRRAAYTRNVTIEELLTGAGPFSSDFLDAGPGGGGGSGGLPTTLDLRVSAENTLIVRNNVADAVGSAFLNIRGRVENPLISGRVSLTRGTIEFRNGRHELTRGIITLPPKRGSDPIIDVHTEAEISGYRVLSDFTGPLNKLQTSLRSEPELPEGDVISLVLTGNVIGDDRTQAATTQTGLGLAQSLLAAGLFEQIERGTQRLFGLSRFSIDPLIVGRGSDPTARITLGQRVAKNLTITYSQNLTSSGPSGIDRIVLVEYRLSNRFSVVGFRNDRSEFGFDVRVMKRF